MASARGFLTATEAAARLGVKASTLYAYVSRGLLRSEATDGAARARRYAARDVERLLERKRMRQEPSLAAARALWWGAPVVESSISFVDGKRLFYRGLEAVPLSERTSFERVASLLWTGSLGRDEPWCDATALPAAAARVVETMAGESTPLAQLQLLTPLFALRDESRFDTSAVHVVATAKRIIMNLTMAISGAARAPRKRRASGVASGLFFSLSGRTASEASVRAMDRALVLCAEHELNASTFAARVAASAGADPYAVVAAALATLSGPKHGGACDRIEALVREVERPERAARVVFARSARGESLPGFGHPLYPDGDPRARPLLEMAREQRAPKAGATLETVLAIVDAAAETSHGAPTLDIALVAVAAALQLPPGSAACIFAIGRIAGWIAHALEQYAMDELIRPRARYVGPKVEAS